MCGRGGARTKPSGYATNFFLAERRIRHDLPEMLPRLRLANLVTLLALHGCASVVVPLDGGDARPATDTSTEAPCTMSSGWSCPRGARCGAPDGCNTCQCSATGTLSCTELACPDAGRTCGTRSCGPTEFCLRPCCVGSNCTDPLPRCVPLPDACNGTPSCDCVGFELCRSTGGGSCGGLIQGDLQCACF